MNYRKLKDLAGANQNEAWRLFIGWLQKMMGHASLKMIVEK
jgi:hypothetical protein